MPDKEVLEKLDKICELLESIDKKLDVIHNDANGAQFFTARILNIIEKDKARR